MKSRSFIFFSLVSAALCAAQAQDTHVLFAKLTEMANRDNPDAQYHLGMLYNNGMGTSRDLQKAFELFKKSASAGNALAAYKVSCYYAGQFKDVVNVDQSKSLEYNLSAARSGYDLAQLEVGDIYGIQKKQFAEAAKWWKLAGDQGDAGSYSRLAELYHEGRGVEKDSALGYAYLKLAVRLSKSESNPKAVVRLTEYKSKLSAAELDRAERFVTEWKSQVSDITLKARKGIQAAEDLVKSIPG